MTTYDILVANGPNLGFLGSRQPEIYGDKGMQSLRPDLEMIMGERAASVNLLFFQANGEGEMIDRLERAREEKVDGIVLNAGAYTHTSLAIADCLAWIGAPCVETHLSNVLAREDIRRKSLIGPHVIGVVAGFGMLSYALAVQALVRVLDARSEPGAS